MDPSTRIRGGRSPGGKRRLPVALQRTASAAAVLASALLLGVPGFATWPPEDPETTLYLGIPWSATDAGNFLTADEYTLVRRRADLYMEDTWRSNDYLHVNDRVPCVFYYNLTSQPFTYFNALTPAHDFFGPVNYDETAFFHGSDPACLAAFSTAGGIELHWRPDIRFTPFVPGAPGEAEWPLNVTPLPVTRYSDSPRRAGDLRRHVRGAHGVRGSGRGARTRSLICLQRSELPRRREPTVA